MGSSEPRQASVAISMPTPRGRHRQPLLVTTDHESTADLPGGAVGGDPVGGPRTHQEASCSNLVDHGTDVGAVIVSCCSSSCCSPSCCLCGFEPTNETKAVRVRGERWSLLTLRDMLVGTTRFNDLSCQLPGPSRTFLSKRLRQFQAAGIVGQLDGEHGLTDAGQ